ncbi:MAG: Ribonuclease HII [Chlamydiae bacterium]|nr:Ribonuclease HII [Chlamydiota bacterium]
MVLESEARSVGFTRIAGVDEAGRGPLAGPVVAAACVLGEGVAFPGIDDSKTLSSQTREALFSEITGHKEVAFGVGIVSAAVIDQINILQATLQAMREAVLALSVPPDFLLVDGTHLPFPDFPSRKVVKGDSLSQSIAAASILAKVTRDKMMLEWDQEYPEYGFASHKGYGTRRHREALAKYGPSPLHRKSFSYEF